MADDRDAPSSERTPRLDHARRYYAERAWSDAFDAFEQADRKAPLAPDDLEKMAWAAALTARDDTFIALMERLYRVDLDAGDAERAALAAFWCGFRLLSLGEAGRGSAWLGRSEQLVEGRLGESFVSGYLQIPKAFRRLIAGQPDQARVETETAIDIGERLRDENVVALGHYMRGRCLVQEERVQAALSALDQAMLSASSGSLAPIVTGLVYCGVIASCHKVYAFDRCREWTTALASWCDAQPQLTTFSGICRVHRAQIFELEGAWDAAVRETEHVSASPGEREDRDARAGAAYEQAEIHRLRGEFEEAEAAYREANRFGQEPQPGFALLRLAQGRHDEAVGGIRRAVKATAGALSRARYLPALVEILLSVGRLDDARDAADELTRTAGDLDIDVLRAMARHAEGAVLLAQGNAEAALSPLRGALATWLDVGAPYIAARIRMLIAQACEVLGDTDGALLEREAARGVFERLGARLDLENLSAPAPDAAPAAGADETHGLTARELEVLRLLATGKTNKAIASDLSLSRKTVDRHVSNIFVKLGVGSRSAATAYAYRSGLV